MPEKQYVNVSEFIQSNEELRSDGTYYYHDSLFAYAYPEGENLRLDYFGDASHIGFSSKDQLMTSLPDISGTTVKKLGIVNGTLVILESTGTIHFIKGNGQGDIDQDFIDTEFEEVLEAHSISTFDYQKTPNGTAAIFVDGQGKPIFYRIVHPANVNEYIAGRFIDTVAVSHDESFCLRFSNNEMFFYNGDALAEESYKLIPYDIVTSENYDIDGFEESDLVSPNDLGRIKDVVANNGFAVLTEKGRIVVWGGNFQPINENSPSHVKPRIFDNIDKILVGVDYGVCKSQTGKVMGWGVNEQLRLSELNDLDETVHDIYVSDKSIVYTTGRGRSVNLLPSTEIVNDSLTTAIGGSMTDDIRSRLSYVKDVAVLNDSVFAFVYIEQVNESFDPVRIDFKMIQHNGDFFIPLSDYFMFDLAGVRMEVYHKFQNSGGSLGQNIKLGVDASYVSVDGNPDRSKVIVSPIDINRNGVPDDPFAFKKIVGDNDFIFMETFIDTDGTESTRVSRNVRRLSEVSFIAPDQVYYADVDRTLKDIFQEEHIYKRGNFYRGEVGNDSVILNRGVVLLGGFDEGRGKRYSIENGRAYSSTQPFMFQWNHYSTDGGDLIDPSISNLMDMYILTSSYDLAVRRWLRSDGDRTTMPKPPTSEELRTMIRFIESNKSTSDQIIYIPAKYKLLFGPSADPEHQAIFNVVKASGATMSDNEIKSRVINAINEYFDIDNWDFGDRFYFSELSAFIHNELAGELASVVVVPRFRDASFGDLYQIRSEPNELFLSTASVDDVTINPHYTEQNMRRI